MTNIEQVKKAAMEFDWLQVSLNGGPPCFHICDDGKFCGRAEGWEGHEYMHDFTSLVDLIVDLNEKSTK